MYKICKNTHEQIMHHVNNSQKEHGGDLKIIEQDKLLVLNKTHSQGETHAVIIPSSRLEWHTHPKKCTKEVCALALPSSDDMKLCLERGLKRKCEVHFVYTYLGVFVIYCIESSKQVQKTPVECENIINDYWKSHKRSFENQQLTINTYLTKWLSKIDELGYVVDFIECKNNTPPTCNLSSDL
jgi:hypothetical protein